MNHVQFLEDMVSYYSEDTSRIARGSNGRCMYLTSDGRKCAIGRHILPSISPEVIASLEGQSADMVAGSPDCRLFPEWMYKLSTSFIYSVQCFHDSNIYWNKNSLSSVGKETFEFMLKEARDLDIQYNL